MMVVRHLDQRSRGYQEADDKMVLQEEKTECPKVKG